MHLKKTILTFVLLSWISSCHADILFNKLVKKINAGTVCTINYNPAKTAAIVDDDCRSAIYINFKTKKTYTIVNDKLMYHVYSTWLNDTIATVQNGCGTGCLEAVIFAAPAMVVSCSVHEYRIESLDPHKPPDYYHNRPLLVDPKRGIYVCYDQDDNIQVFPLPKQATIHPPKGFFSEKAEIRDGKLMVIYEDGHGKTKRVGYSL